MALQSFPGSPFGFIGPNPWASATTPSTATSFTMDAANEAVIMIGQIVTSDGGSHTIDTTGSSSIFWRTGAVTFANAGTTVKVGLAAVNTTTGPPGRAVNVADVITFDVSKSMTGGGGGVTANASQNNVPDTGTKTIANGDLVAFAVQMTARAGADTVDLNALTNSTALQRPGITTFAGGAYGSFAGAPNIFITFSDGATGWFYGGDVNTTSGQTTWNSSSATKEYGQLYVLPFPLKIYGIYGWTNAGGDFDAILYSDPLGTPVAEKTVSIDANTVAAASGRRFAVLFSSPYTTTASQSVGAVFKPGATNLGAYFKTLGAAGQRVSDVWGASGYGINRASGAFANANSSLDHYYIGLLVGAFDDGAAGAGGPVGQQSM